MNLMRDKNGFNELMHDTGYDRFPYALYTQYLPKENKWLLVDIFQYIDPTRKRTITGKPGYKSDLGTVPRICRSIVGKSEFPWAYVIHDIACDRLKWDNGDKMTQHTADKLFIEIVKYVYKGKKWKIRLGWIAYSGIRVHSVMVKTFKRKN